MESVALEVESQVSEISKLAQQATQPHVVDVGDTELIIFDPITGTAHKRQVLPPRRKHKIDSLVSLLNVIEEFKEAARVFISPTEIRIVVDDADRRDYWSMTLQATDHFKRIADLGAALTQDRAVRLFFHELWGACTPGFHNSFRKIEFQNGSTGTRSVQRDQESLGSSITNQVSAASEVPESIEVNPSVYSNDGLAKPVPVTLTIEILHSSNQFLIVSAPEALNNATKETLTWVAKQVEEAGVVPVIGSFS